MDSAVSRMIRDTRKECKIVPDEFADIESEEVVFQLVTMSSDGPYLKKQHETGGPATDYALRDLLYLGELYEEWVYDFLHELEKMRRDIA